MMTALASHPNFGEEDYTDYSCSTALERLTRDVETVLRAWHVDQGCDRHVSLLPEGKVEDEDYEYGNGGGGGGSSDPTCPIIRSNTLVWHIPVTTSTGRSTVVVDLELALWDAPSGQGVGESNGLLGDIRDVHREDVAYTEEQSALVKSLQRAPFGKMPVHDYLFDNFARLFGIGQHISLSPIHPEPLPSDLMEFLATSIVERHEPRTTAPLILASTLSVWLQTALNCATSNCRCAIPAFGVWGQYRPNELSPEIRASKRNSTQSIVGGLMTTTGTLGGGGDHMSLSGLSQNPDFVGTTIHTQDAASTTSGMMGNQHQHQQQQAMAPPRGIPVFPQWAQALRNAKLPPVSKAYQRRAGHHWNARFIPPLVCGRVTGNVGHHPLDTPTTAATMWISATTELPGIQDQEQNAHHALTASSRLTIWGNLLLQHSGDSSCVLHGARHVFGWFKAHHSNHLNNSNNNNSIQSTLFRSSQIDSQIQEWRYMNNALISTPKPDDSEFKLYQKHCQAHAMDLLEDAWSRDRRQLSSSSTLHTSMDYWEFQQQRSSLHATQAPVWGPIDDPVTSVYATTTWSGQTAADGAVAPLLTFPLRMRSARPVSKKDWAEMEETIEESILDPLMPSRFVVQVYYDRDTSVATLAANQRCVLAALVRSATLPGETLLTHLTDRSLVELWDDDAGTVVASKVAGRSKCSSCTIQIVQAMDWNSIMEDMITAEQAEEIVHSVMKGDLVAGFPSSPEESFIDDDEICRPFEKAAPFGRLLSLLFANMAKLRGLSSMSLVWTVFCQELRRRWEVRESLPNMQYIAGLDPHPLKLYEKRCFTSIGHAANFAAFLNCCEPDPDDYHCLIGQKLQVFQVGVECIVAREMLEQEVMERFLEQGEVPASAKVDRPPDLISTGNEDDPSEEDTSMWRPAGGDKVKVSDIAVADAKLPASHSSQILASSTNSKKKRKWPKAKGNSSSENGERKDYGPPTINSDLEFWVMDEPGFAPRDAVGKEFAPYSTDDTGFDFVIPVPKELEDVEVDESVSFRRRSTAPMSALSGWEGTIMQDDDCEDEGEDDDDEDDSEGSGDSVASQTTLGEMSQAYFDAAEAGSIFSTKHGFVTLDTVVNVADMKRRPGARCPVHKVTLRGTGDQLYAPYLQRPCPLTDDLVLERKHMLASEQREGESRKAVLQARIELAHRLQRPKLMSDMSAFKAANPNASIDDFTRWYGNPGSPLDDYDDPLPEERSTNLGSSYETAAKKLDRASEAMKVLMATRDFWASAWEQAPQVPASEQEPLFDYESTVEMAIDYLEQMHPANLVNQVMAVNLSSAYFALASSAEDVIKVGLVRTSILKLRKKIEQALQCLSDDATGALFQANISDNASTSTATANQYISEESIYACEEACNALRVTETILSRAVSLLSKFPSQYTLVQDLLKLMDGTTVALTDPVGRRGFFNAILLQQRCFQGKPLTARGLSDSTPQPVLREYILRNLDEDKPCQLAVRFGDSGAYLGRVDNEGGILLAMTKSYTD